MRYQLLLIVSLLPLFMAAQSQDDFFNIRLQRIDELRGENTDPADILRDSSINRGLAEARRAHSKNAEAHFLSAKGLLHFDRLQYDAAIQSYKSSIDQAEDDSLLIAAGYINIGICYKRLSRYSISVENLIQACRIYENTIKATDNDSSRKELTGDLASAENTLANVFRELRDFSKALRYYEHSRAKRIWINDSVAMASSHNNIGEYYYKTQQSYVKAIICLNNALRIKEALGDDYETSSTLEALGEVYMTLGNEKAALIYLRDAYNKSNATSNREVFASACNNLGKLHLNKNQLKEAAEFLEEGRYWANEIESSALLRQNYKLSSTLYKLKKELQRALDFAEFGEQIGDTILNKEEFAISEDVEASYRNEQVTAKNEELTKETNLKSTQLQSLSTVLILLLVLIVIVFLAYRNNKHKKEKIEVLMKELNHRVKNNLQVLHSLMSLQLRQLKDEEAKHAITEDLNRLRALSVIHQKLYSGDSVTDVPFDQFITDLARELAEGYGFGQGRLMLTLNLQPVIVNVDAAIPLAIIVNEVLCNAFKYAFINEQAPALHILLRSHKKSITLEIGDNGPGLPDGASSTNSFGMKLINMMSRQLEAEHRFEKRKGTLFHLTINA